MATSRMHAQLVCASRGAAQQQAPPSERTSSDRSLFRLRVTKGSRHACSSEGDKMRSRAIMPKDSAAATCMHVSMPGSIGKDPQRCCHDGGHARLPGPTPQLQAQRSEHACTQRRTCASMSILLRAALRGPLMASKADLPLPLSVEARLQEHTQVPGAHMCASSICERSAATCT